MLTLTRLLCLATAVALATAEVAALPLRAVCFNVENGLYAAETSSYRDTATVLKRINADVVGLCELMEWRRVGGFWDYVGDRENFPQLAKELGLPHTAFDESPTDHRAGIASRYPIEETIWVAGSGMTRRIPLARIAVPGARRPLWVAMLHLKARHTDDLEQHMRAAELFWLRQAILANCDVLNDSIVIMGDFNLVSPSDVVFTDPRFDGVAYPLAAPRDADGYFMNEGIFKLAARHAGDSGDTWTWRSNGEFASSALDHIMVNAALRARGAAAEVYNAEQDAAGAVGLPKLGAPPPSALAYISDHLPMFADLDLDDGAPYDEADFRMDGMADSADYILDHRGITLRVALRGTRLYVATQSAANQSSGNDHHILISPSLLAGATAPAAWNKRGSTALPQGHPFLAAEGVNDHAAWANAASAFRLRKSGSSAGVLEGSLDLMERFGAVPEFIYVAAVAYETSDASFSEVSAGRVIDQTPPANVPDDNITPDEFLRIPLRSVTDSAADGVFDILVPSRGFRAAFSPAHSGGPAQVRWPAVPGRTYRVMRTANLASAVWQELGEITPGGNEWEAGLADSAPDVDRGFYRVELVPLGH